MKSLAFGLLVLAMAAAATPAAKAGTVTYYPLTFGSNFPFVDEGVPCTSTTDCYVGLLGETINGTAIGGPPSLSIQTVTFTFDIAPGWAINYMSVSGSLDYGYAGESTLDPTPFSDWGIEFVSQLTLCSADDVCSTAGQVLTRGGAPLPPVSFNTEVGAGTGVYQTFLYLDNADIASDSIPGLSIIVSETGPVPEPSSWLFLVAGLPGLVAVLFRKANCPTLVRDSGC
jgi:hypothetical protein